MFRCFQVVQLEESSVNLCTHYPGIVPIPIPEMNVFTGWLKTYYKHVIWLRMPIVCSMVALRYFKITLSYIQAVYICVQLPTPTKRQISTI